MSDKEQKREETVWWCPECGPNPRCDEDGLCCSCGCTIGEIPNYPARTARARVLAEARRLELSRWATHGTDDFEYDAHRLKGFNEACALIFGALEGRK